MHAGLKRSNVRLQRSGLSRIVFFVCLLAVLPAGARGQDEETDLISRTKNMLEEWIDLRKVIAKEKSDWAVGKELLEDEIAVMERQIAAAEDKIAETEKSIRAAEKERRELEAKRQRYSVSSTFLREEIVGLEAETARLLAKAPAPAREAVKPLSQQFPKNQDDTNSKRLSSSTRFMNLIGVLNELNKYNGKVSTGTEVMNMGGGRSAEVATVYFGLGQGYYVTLDDRRAGIGFSDAGSWTWRASNDAAANIREVLRILSNERPASYVALPVEVH